MGANTLFLRLEGPLQAWGNASKFVIRDTGDEPSKSAVLGMVLCAMGVARAEARPHLQRLNALRMGVRVDRPGVRWHDYHTVGAGIGMRTADGKLKTGAQGTLITRRYYLADASFLVALQGEELLVSEAYKALADPEWPVYLGRKSCPPSVPIVRPKAEDSLGGFATLKEALSSKPWRPRLAHVDEAPPGECPAVIEWRPTPEQPELPPEAECVQDTPFSLDPPVQHPRYVTRTSVPVHADEPVQWPLPRPTRPRADYGNSQYRKRRAERLDADGGLCVFCKHEAKTVQHVTYRHAGGRERQDELRSLCRLCHDAVTMIEYGLNMGLDRINPEDPVWRDRIIAKRAAILRFRSLATRRRRLAAEEV